MLLSSDTPLAERYDLAVLDLDGVVYVGPQAVPGAPEALTRARAGGMSLAYVTNNAARPPEQVAAHLRDLGVPAEDGDVVTSAQAAARVLAADLPAGSPIFVIGGDGLLEALREQGLEPVLEPDPEPAAVVQGYGPDMPWRRVVAGAILVSRGLPWVASNTDSTIPTAIGVGPGNGALVELVARYAGRSPRVAGKPERPLFEETRLRVGGERPLVVGDRLDTDIRGATGMGWPSLLVLTGVTGLAELAAAPADERPSYIAPDLRGLLEPQPAPSRGESGSQEHFELGGWVATSLDGALRVDGDGADADWWRVAAEAAWSHLDGSGTALDVSEVRPPDAR